MKKRLLYGFVGLIVTLVVAILVVPSLIDWNDYKIDVARQVKQSTGRDLTIQGDLKISVLPTPKLSVEGVSFANIPGAQAPAMVSLKKLEVQVAFGPLLGGSIQVDTVRLVEPVIELEALADGRVNWEMAPQAKSTSTIQAIPPKSGQGGTVAKSEKTEELPVKLDDFTIINGTFVYRDQIQGTVERFEGINARIVAASLEGPFQSSGRLAVRGLPVSYELSLGKLIEGRTASVNLALDSSVGVTDFEINGTLLDLQEAPKFKGHVELEGKHLASLVQQLTGGGEQPGFLGQSIKLEGDVLAGVEGLSSKDMSIRLGDAQGRANINIAAKETISAEAGIRFSKINLDKWLALPNLPAKTLGLAKAAPATQTTTDKTSPTSPVKKVEKIVAVTDKKVKELLIPENVNGAVALVVDAIAFKGELIRETRLNADIASGEITLSQASAMLPGGTDVAAFGFLSSQGGKPRLDGEVEANVADLRAVSRWLGAEINGVPSDRLRKLSFKSKVYADPSQIQVADILVGFDSSKLRGGITLALRDRLAFGAEFSLDQLNLDAYLPKKTKTAAIKGKAMLAKRGQAAGGVAPKGAEKVSSPINPIEGLTELGSFDTNMKLTVGKLIHQGVSVKNIHFDGTLFNGNLDIRRASVGDIAGATASVKGKLNGLNSLPKMENISFNLDAKNIAGLSKLARTPLPVDPKALGAIALQGTVNGAFLAPQVGLMVKAAGGNISLQGKADLWPIAQFKGKLAANHPNLNKLLQVVGDGYRPPGALGKVTLNVGLVADIDGVHANNLLAEIAGAPVNGNIHVNLQGTKPFVDLDLMTGKLVVDHFVLTESEEKKKTAQRKQRSASRPIVGSRATRRTAGNAKRAEVWSKDPIDLAALNAFDGRFKIQSEEIIYDAYNVQELKVLASLKDGLLKTEKATGKVFGGLVDLKAEIDGRNTPHINAALSLQDIDILKSTRAVTGSKIASGRLNSQFNLATKGLSLSDMIKALDGKAAINLDDVNVYGLNQNALLAAPLALLGGFDSLSSTLTGKKDNGLASLTASFDIQNGLARTQDLRITSGLGDGAAKGWLDLAGWSMDITGEIDLSKDLIGMLVVQKNKVPFALTGALDAPNVKVDAGGLTIPGTDKLLGETENLLGKKGLGGLLEKIIPGVKKSSSSTTPAVTSSGSGTTSSGNRPPPPRTSEGSETAPPPTQEKKKLRPEDLIKNILRF